MKSSHLRTAPTSALAKERVLELLLDVFGATLESLRQEPRAMWVDLESRVAPSEALVWFDGRHIEASHAALVNGTRAHHAELDDGHPGASLHGGVTIIPAALATAESIHASGAALIDAIAFGYAVAVSCGRALLPGIVSDKAHPPSRVGCLGAAAASAKLLGLDDAGIAGAVSLAATLMPFGPFESFTRGASVKDLYGGFPAHVGVHAALAARAGITGPTESIHCDPIDREEVLRVAIKAWPACRSTHATLTALERLHPFPSPVAAVTVETYPFACELSLDADPSTPIGRKASIPHAVAEAFTEISPDRVTVTSSDALAPSGARVSLRFSDGPTLEAQVDAPREETNVRQKFRRNAFDRAPAIEEAVASLPEASSLDALRASLS